MSVELETITVIGQRSSRSTSMSISAFKEAIGTVARPNLFEAVLYGGPEDLSDADDIVDSFPFRCEAAEIPGRSLITTDESGGGGPALKTAHDVQYNDISLTIICSEDMKERYFFEKWMDSIVAPAGSSKAGLVSFYDNYAMNNRLEVTSLNSYADKLYTTRMYYVYPTALSPMSASWEDTNTYQRFQVTMNYRFYTVTKYF